jgi:amino acid adenylation domain-containing protein
MPSNRHALQMRPKDTAGETDYRRLVLDLNATEVDLPADEFLSSMLAKQARRTPTATAVVDATGQLTYGELDDRSNKLANYLIDNHGVGTDSLVALCIDRSLGMIVGLVGIVKAGAAYLPLDPTYPADRLGYMLVHAKPGLVLTQQSLDWQLPVSSAAKLRLDTDWHLIETAAGTLPRPRLKPDDLAYVIYTSGSTGKPKGVIIPQRALANHMLWMQAAFPLGADDIVLQKTPISFDASVWEIFSPLISGARLVLAGPEGHKDPKYLVRAVVDHRVTTLQLVPSVLRLFLQEPDVGRITSLRNVFCGGEALTADLRDDFFARLDANLHNLYGPTETCIQVVVYSCARNGQQDRRNVPIGRPIWNAQVYVLDENRSPVSFGEEGELYIGGACLARGYLGQPELTSERFVDNPFGSPGSRLYRTGDLVRYRPDSNLEFIGRADNQIKLRGYRVELEEIEASLMTHPGVREAAIVVDSSHATNNRLIAHIVASADKAIEADGLRSHLRRWVPEYMVPAVFEMTSALPRLPNGKIDRKALASRPVSVAGAGVAAPLSPTEAALAEIWARVIGVENIGREDDFFDLGGTSLAFVDSFLQANQRFGTNVDIGVVSQGATIAALAACFEKASVN